MMPVAGVSGTAPRGWGPARQTLRALLARHPALAASTATLDALIGQVDFTCCQPGQDVVPPGVRTDGVHIVVGGVVKIVCAAGCGTPVTVQLVAPGGFVRLGAPSDAVVRVRAVAHTPALIACLSAGAWREVARQLRVEDGLRLASCGWQDATRRLYDKCVMLAQPIRERVLHELRILARDFGRPHPAGVCIDVPLSHADLASLVGAARANVTRAVGGLRAQGRVVAAPGRFVLAGG